MFTGIVEEKGKVRYMQLNGESGVLAVKAKKVLEGTKIGDSIAINGVCLTVTSAGWIYCGCDGRDNPTEQSWKLQGRKLCESGTGNGSRWKIRRAYCKWPY